MDQAEPSIVAVRETLTTFAHTFPKGRSVPELQQVLTSIGASRDLGGVPAAEIPAEFTKAVTTRVDEILSGNPSAQELRGLLEMVERNSASLPSLTDKPWAAALIRLTQANREIGVLSCDSLAKTPDGELAGRVRLSSGRCVPFKGDTLIKTIGGKEVRGCDNIHTAPDGDLAGRVRLSSGRCVPFTGDTLLETIGGKEVRDCDNIHTAPDSDLAGRVQLAMVAVFPFRVIPSSKRSAGKRSGVVATSTRHRAATSRGRCGFPMIAGFPFRVMPSSKRSAGKRSGIVPVSTRRRTASFGGMCSLQMASGYLYSTLDTV